MFNKKILTVCFIFTITFTLTFSASALRFGVGPAGALIQSVIKQMEREGLVTHTPQEAPRIVAIGAGNDYSIALDAEGNVWAWGNNEYGRLGDGTLINRRTPVKVSGGAQGGAYLCDIVAISCGSGLSLALDSEGRLWAWGTNVDGGLGDGTTVDRNTPVQVHGGAQGGTFFANSLILGAGALHSIVLDNTGNVWTWGRNHAGQLGDGTYGGSFEEHDEGIDKTVPVQVKGGEQGGTYLTNIIAVTPGGNHSLALDRNGYVWSWGDNMNGQLGIGLNGGSSIEYDEGVDKHTPVQVKGGEQGGAYLGGIIAIAAGCMHSLALDANGHVWTWGQNSYGELGVDGVGLDRMFINTPVRVVGGAQGGAFLENIEAIAGGWFYSVALDTNGNVWTWGKGKRTPARVKGGAQGGPYLTNIVAIAGGTNHTLALDAAGNVWAWGDNTYVQLGDGTVTTRLTPVRVRW